MTTRLVHRPARATRPLPEPEPRTIEAPPNLPEGKAAGAAMSLLPIAGVMSSVVMMTVLRSGQFAAIGALVLVVTVVGALVLLFSQRGRAQRTRRQQRERYLEYLEELREELGAEERAWRATARLLDPPPQALYDVVRDPARLWERRRTDPDFLRVRIGTGEMPLRPLTVARQSGSVLTPPDPFMLNEAGALVGRYALVTDLPLTVPLDRVGNVSVVGERDAVLRVVRALLVQTAATHAPDDVALALAAPGDRVERDWAWLKWLPHLLDAEERDGPVAARRIAPDLPQLARLLGRDLRQRAAYAAEVRRGLSGADALGLSGSSCSSSAMTTARRHGSCRAPTRPWPTARWASPCSTWSPSGCRNRARWRSASPSARTRWSWRTCAAGIRRAPTAPWTTSPPPGPRGWSGCWPRCGCRPNPSWTPRCPGPSTSRSCWASTTPAPWTWPVPGHPAASAPSCGCPSASTTPTSRCCST
ncbi:hypothetical protein ACFQ10_39545 [Streptomyces indonesiensis]